MAAVPPDSWQPPTVSMETTMGPLVLELYWKHAPRTCKNFAELCRRGYYNGTKFHRVIKDFMVQGGDPTGTGAGILAMANAGPDTNGSQFFLTLAPAQWLDGKHSIFGRVSQGMAVLGRLAMVETNAQDRPLDDVKVIKAFPSG
ncbi:Ppil1 [Columba guinea]|nr:Ppil1 [Columba guinea]